MVSDYVNHKIKELGTSILDGEIALNPYEQSKQNACTYWNYRGICGFDRKLGSGLIRELDEIDQDIALERMKGEV